MLSIVEKIWADTNLSIGGSPTGHNPVVSSINSLYLVGTTRSSKAPDLMSDPTNNFGIIKYHNLRILQSDLYINNAHIYNHLSIVID